MVWTVYNLQKYAIFLIILICGEQVNASHEKLKQIRQKRFAPPFNFENIFEEVAGDRRLNFQLVVSINLSILIGLAYIVGGKFINNTVELPYSKLGPSQQNVYYKEVSKFPLFSQRYVNKSVHKTSK